MSSLHRFWKSARFKDIVESANDSSVSLSSVPLSSVSLLSILITVTSGPLKTECVGAV